MNREESWRCFEIAKGYYNKGDYEQKSDLTIQYIKTCQEKIQQGGTTSHEKGNPTHRKNHREENKAKVTPGSSYQSNEPVVIYPSQGKKFYLLVDMIQPEDVKKILSTKDFYELLGVSKTSTDDEVKKAYRKLALKYHPDKNSAPKADDAFKKIAQAYDCLSNPEKKKKYDEHGNEEPERHFQHYRQYHSDEVSPEEIFNVFFTSFGMPTRGKASSFYYSSRGDTRNPNRGSSNSNSSSNRSHYSSYRSVNTSPKDPLKHLMRFLPVLIMIAILIFINFTREEPIYSNSQSYRFPIAKKTADLGYVYYVDKEFQDRVVTKNPTKLKDVMRFDDLSIRILKD